MSAPPVPEPGALLELEVDALAFGGAGVGRLPGEGRGLAVFVPGALPGERVRVRLLRRHRRHLEAELLEVLRASPERVEPRCPLHGRCGGCALQHLRPEAQLRALAGQVVELLSRLGGAEPARLLPPLPSPAAWRYRHRAEFSLEPGQGRWRLGYRPRGGGPLLELRDCALLHPALARWLPVFPALLPGLGGEARRLRLRHGEEGELAVLVGEGPPPPGLGGLWKELSGLGLAGLAWARARGREPPRIAWSRGRLALHQRVGALRLRATGLAFTQVNPGAEVRLHGAVRGAVESAGARRVVDLYCGVGALGLVAGAGGLEELVGLERDRSAVEDARANARANGVEARFLRADAGRPPRGLSLRDRLVIVDPPRGGLSRGARRLLLEQRPRALLYVSCHPATLARDLRELAAGGYAPRSLQVVDLFPQTGHVESVLLLERRPG